MTNGTGQIEVTIDLDGHATIHVQGVKGARCLDLTKALEAELGTVTSRMKTEEFFAKEVNVQVKTRSG